MACFTPEQYHMVINGLLDAFIDRTTLAVMLRAIASTPKVQQYPNSPIVRRLQNINRITSEQVNMEKIVYDVVQVIEASNLCWELVKTAHEWNPFDPNLVALNQQFMHINTVEPQQETELEALLSITREQFLNPLTFAERFGPIRYRVCRVEIGAKEASTRKAHASGFLVGPDVVLTNHHVVEPVLQGIVQVDQFVFGFDRVEWVDGTQTAGPTYGLKPLTQQGEWLLAMSEPLDYALLRLDMPAGDLPIIINDATTPTVRPATRGWLALSEQGSFALDSGKPLLIFQHPDGLPLRLDIRTVSVLSETRVTYTTNTMPGSSGSPCFDRELRVSALHRGYTGALNEGIPVAAILADLAQKGLQDAVTLA